MEEIIKEKAAVSLRACENYEMQTVRHALQALFDDISVKKEEISGKRVVIKPNLVRKMDISAAGTTNPFVVEALIALCAEYGAKSVTVAESPAGPYTEASLRASYKVGKMDEAAKNAGAELNFDLSAKRVASLGHSKERTFNIITPIVEADLVINVSKLKTHNLTGMSGAVKNLFGVIPGTEKLEMHALYPNLSDFSAMICDLCETVCKSVETLHVIDAVIGMEGNGPTNGKPRKLGFMGASRSPFALDEACAEIIGMKEYSSINAQAKTRGFLPDYDVLGDGNEAFVCKDFILPDSSDTNRSAINILSKIFGGKLMESLRPRPVVDGKKCVGCGECARSCPAKTIVITDKKVALIYKKDCIKCFCCQELCPKDAIRVKKNPILKLVGLFT